MVRATRPLDASDTQAHRIPLKSPRSMVARAAQTQQGIIVSDITNTPDFSLTPFLADARSEMAVPMVVADRLIGVLDIQSPEVDRFTEGCCWRTQILTPQPPLHCMAEGEKSGCGSPKK